MAKKRARARKMSSLSVSSRRLYLRISFLPRWMVPVMFLNSSLVSCTVLEEVAVVRKRRERRVIKKFERRWVRKCWWEKHCKLDFVQKLQPWQKYTGFVFFLPSVPMVSSLCFTCSDIILLIDIRLSVMLLLVSTRPSLVAFLRTKTHTHSRAGDAQLQQIYVALIYYKLVRVQQICVPSGIVSV